MMVYIGQTTNTVEYRYEQHWNDSRTRERRLARGEKYNCCNKLYKAFAEHGRDAFIVETIAEVDGASLNATEKRLITEHDSIKFGYNSIGGTDNVPKPDVKERRHARIVAAREENPEYDPLTYDLPTYCMRITKRGIEGLAICHHPLCDHKEFMLCTYDTLEAAKEALLVYLAELTERGVKEPGLVKREPELPKGVCKIKKCYFVDKTIDGKTFRKAFSEGTDEVNRADAIAYVEKILSTPGMIPEPTKKDADLTKGITRRDNIYLVSKTIKGVAYRERFDTLIAAETYLAEIIATPPTPPAKFVKKDTDLSKGITKISHKYVVCKNINKIKYKQSFDDKESAEAYLKLLTSGNACELSAQNTLL